MWWKNFKDIFSDVPSLTNLVSHKIVLNSNVPVRCKPYPVPLHLLKDLDKEIDSLLEAKIIEPSQAFYASPVVMIKKPSGEIRVAINYKNLNKNCFFDPEPSTNADEIFDKIGGSKFYSKFDLCKGYYQIPLEEDSRDYSTMICHRGLFRFRSLPFGLASASSTFNRMMRKLLDTIENFDAYIDDVLCHTSDWDSHLRSLENFFQRVREANIKLKLSKCEIGFQSIEFLGHRIIEDARTPNPANLNKILEATRPQTKKQIMSLMGLLGFYSAFIPSYSEICVVFTDLLKKNLPNKITWEDKHERAFQYLKQCFLSEPILKLPRLDRPFVLQTDECDRSIGAALLQIGDDHILHPVSFCSRKMSPTECLYSISERECLAVIFAVQKYRRYLYGAHFELQTDHKALSVLTSPDTTSPRLQRWSLALQQYRYTNTFISGKDNIFGDFFSRHVSN